MLVLASGSCTTSTVLARSMCFVSILIRSGSWVYFVFVFIVFIVFLVVEIDMPWSDDSAATYGESFKAWTEEQLTSVLSSIISSLPHNKLATIVTLSHLLSVIGLSFLGATRFCSSRVKIRPQDGPRFLYV